MKTKKIHKGKILEVIKHLKEKGYKITPQRKAIIDIIINNRDHPSTSEIIRLARSIYPNISVSTVYYTIALLKREGLIREIEFYDKDNRYDTNLNHHINLICESCGKIIDFDNPLPISIDDIFEKFGFKTVQTRYEYYGYCKTCLSKSRRAE
ncbi:MAG: Fur family transcriptional regulator [Thermodesulfovibrionales bacterium]